MTPSGEVVRVITDSAAALSPADAAAHNVEVVPMAVQVAGRSATEAEAGAGPTEPGQVSSRTSAPSPGQYLAAISDGGTSAGAVIVTVAGTLSASYRAAQLASRLLAESDDVPVAVVDSGSAAGAQALVVLAAARSAAGGAPVADVAAAAHRTGAAARLVGTVGSLDALVNGGRLPRAAAVAGRLAGVHPMFELRAGRIRVLRPAFSRSAAIDTMIAAFRRDHLAHGAAEIAISHADAEAEAQQLLARLTEIAAPAVAIVGGFGAAMVAHAGRGTLGVAWGPHS